MTRLRRCLSMLFVLSLLSLAAGTARAASADEEPALRRMLEAIAQGNHAAFMQDATPAFAQLPPAAFQGLVDELGPTLQTGYAVQRLGQIRRGGLVSGIWKVTPDVGEDDVLATLTLVDGKVGGLYLQ